MIVLERLVSRSSHTLPWLVRRLRAGDGLVQLPVEAVAGCWVRVRGRWILNFATINYLGLNQHPHVQQAIINAATRWGTSLVIPRLVGRDRLTSHLETALTNLVGQDEVLIFPSTIHIALDVLPLLARSRGILFVDESLFYQSRRCSCSCPAWRSNPVFSSQ